jgi:PIN domain nuclease of toxin-antitoxin system
MIKAGIVLDASAILAYIFKESGHEVVAEHLENSCISSVNLLEVATRFHRDGLSPEPVIEMIQDLGISIVPFTEKHIMSSALLVNQVKQYGLSMADRVCLGLGMDLNLPVLTGDTLWAKLKLSNKVILFRNSDT